MIGVFSQVMKIVAQVTEKDVTIADPLQCRSFVGVHPLDRHTRRSCFKYKLREPDEQALQTKRYAGISRHEP